MKKIISIILMMVTISVIFAYEPKAECAKVKRNGDIKYYEKTEPYNYYGLTEPDKDYVQWVIRKGYTIEQLVDYQYKRLESFRESYISFMKKAETAEPTRLAEDISILQELIDGTIISPEDVERKALLKCAEREKNTAIISLACVTEKNFLTLTKEEMTLKLKDFINNLY